MTHRSSFPLAGGLSLRLSLAVAAARRGEIHSVGGVDVSGIMSAMALTLRDFYQGMSAQDAADFDLDLGVFCLAVSMLVLPLLGVVQESGASQQAGRQPGPGRAAPKSSSPHGNHGDNNVQGSLPL